MVEAATASSRRGREIARLLTQPGQLEEQPGPRPGEQPLIERIHDLLDAGDGIGDVAGRRQHPGLRHCGAGAQHGQVERRDPHIELGAGRSRLLDATAGQLDVDEHGQELGRPRRIGVHRAQATPDGGPRQLQVATSELEPGERQDGLDGVVLAEEERLGLD